MTSNVPSEELADFIAGEEAAGMDGQEHPDSLTGAQVIFPGALELNREQEDKMVAHFLNRVRDLENQLGRDRAVMNDSAYHTVAAQSDFHTFFGRRRLFELVYHKRMEWRRAALGEIFYDHNLHLPIVRRIVQQQISRAQNYFFATEPWFSAAPQGTADETIATKINAYAQWKFRQAKVAETFNRAIEKAMIRGEAIVKTTTVRDSRWYEDWLEVAIDPATGEPFQANDGGYLEKTDTFTAQIDPATGQAALDPMTGEPAMVLARDGSTPMPQGELVYQLRKVPREAVQYAGPEARLVYYLDFLCPEEAPSIQEADVVAHLYHLPAVTIAQAYLDRAAADPGQKEDAPKILDLLRQAEANINGDDLASSEMALRPEDGEFRDYRVGDETARSGLMSVVEGYLRYDVNGDGRQEDVFLLIDRKTEKPIYYDYTDRVTDKGQRPFHCVRVNPVDERWYGSSQVDLFYDLQQFIDLTMNRWNRAQGDSARVDFWKPECVYEGDGNPTLELNTGKKYRLKPGFTAEDALQSKYLYEIKGQDLEKQMQFFIQIAQTMSGVQNANDANMAGLDTVKLATGIKNLEMSGQELFAPLLGHLKDGLESASASLLRLLAMSMPQSGEVYQFFDGQALPAMDTIRPQDIAQVDFMVEMEMSRYKNEQILAQGLHAVNLVERFYAQLPQMQMVTQTLYRDMLRLFGVKNPEQKIDASLGIFTGQLPVGPPPGDTGPALAPEGNGQSPPNLTPFAAA